MRLLFVCTANRCRSPAAAAMTTRRLEVIGRFREEVGSAGLLAADQPMPPMGVALMARRGYDLSGHRSRLIDDSMLAAVDLVLGLTRAHTRALVARSPESFGRTFSFGEFVRRAEAVQDRAAVKGTRLDQWLARVGEGRRRQELLGEDVLDVADPFGRSERTWQAVLKTIDDLSRRLALQLAGPLALEAD